MGGVRSRMQPWLERRRVDTKIAAIAIVIVLPFSSQSRESSSSAALLLAAGGGCGRLLLPRRGRLLRSREAFALLAAVTGRLKKQEKRETNMGEGRSAVQWWWEY